MYKFLLIKDSKIPKPEKVIYRIILDYGSTALNKNVFVFSENLAEAFNTAFYLAVSLELEAFYIHNSAARFLTYPKEEISLTSKGLLPNRSTVLPSSMAFALLLKTYDFQLIPIKTKDENVLNFLSEHMTLKNTEPFWAFEL